MVGRSVLSHCLRIASAIALLVAVTVSPLRPLRSTSGSLRTDVGRSDFASAPTRMAFPIQVVPTSATSRSVSVKAVRSENEEEEMAGVISRTGDFFIVPPSLRKAPSQNLAVRGCTPLLFPLRC